MRSKLPLILFLCVAVSLTAQTGGNHDLSHNVIAGGGGRSQSVVGNFRLDGTVGQPSAGTVSTGDTFNIRGGFWSMAPLVPNAALASISGRVVTARGRGLINVQVSVTNSLTSDTMSTQTTRSGSYRFSELPVGQTYIVSVAGRRFRFDPNTHIVVLNDDVTVEDFVALP